MAKSWQHVQRASELRPFLQIGSPGWEIHHAVAPHPGDAVIDKIAMSAFEGTPLAMMLRDLGLVSFLVAGIALEIGIEPTARHGADLGLIPIVVEDACGFGHREAAQRSLASLRFAGDAMFTELASCGDPQAGRGSRRDGRWPGRRRPGRRGRRPQRMTSTVWTCPSSIRRIAPSACTSSSTRTVPGRSPGLSLHGDPVGAGTEAVGDRVAAPGRRCAQGTMRSVCPFLPEPEDGLQPHPVHPRRRAGVPAPPSPPEVSGRGVDVARPPRTARPGRRPRPPRVRVWVKGFSIWKCSKASAASPCSAIARTAHSGGVGVLRAVLPDAGDVAADVTRVVRRP